MASTRKALKVPAYEKSVTYLCDSGIFDINVGFVISYEINPGECGGWNGDGYDRGEAAFVEDHKIERIEFVEFQGRSITSALGDTFLESGLLEKLRKELGSLVRQGEFDEELLKDAGF